MLSTAFLRASLGIAASGSMLLGAAPRAAAAGVPHGCRSGDRRRDGARRIRHADRRARRRPLRRSRRQRAAARRLGRVRPSQLTPVPQSDLRGHFDTNEGKNAGRLILVAVDQTHVRRIEGRAALRAAADFIDALEPADRVAAAPLNHGGAIQFTGDHASVKRYLQTLTGEASPVPAHFNVGLVEALAIADGSRTRLDQVVLRECGQPLGRYENPRRLAETEGVRDPCPVQIEQESRAMAQLARTDARLSLDALQRLIARLAEIDGPKTLVLISEGLVAEAQLVDLTALGAAAQAARVTIYVLQLEVPVFEAAESRLSPTFSADTQVRADGLARLAAAHAARSSTWSAPIRIPSGASSPSSAATTSSPSRRPTPTGWTPASDRRVDASAGRDGARASQLQNPCRHGSVGRRRGPARTAAAQPAARHRAAAPAGGVRDAGSRGRRAEGDGRHGDRHRRQPGARSRSGSCSSTTAASSSRAAADQPIPGATLCPWRSRPDGISSRRRGSSPEADKEAWSGGSSRSSPRPAIST